MNVFKYVEPRSAFEPRRRARI